MAITDVVKKKFDERYNRMTTDAGRTSALIIYYIFLATLFLMIILFVPEVALSIITRLLGV